MSTGSVSIPLGSPSQEPSLFAVIYRKGNADARTIETRSPVVFSPKIGTATLPVYSLASAARVVTNKPSFGTMGAVKSGVGLPVEK